MPDISTITTPNGTTYNIKDKTARDAINALTGGSLTYEKVDASVLETPPTSVNMGRIYLVASENGSHDNYDEYLAVSDSGDSYVWEKIGSTGASMDGYVESGTVTTSNQAGISLSAHSVTQGNVSLSTKHTPSGTNEASAVTITPSTTNVYSMTSAGSVTPGSAASFTQGNDSFTNGTLAAFSATVSNENLTFSWTAPTASTFTQGTDSFTPNSPTSVTLPGRSSVVKAWTGYTEASAAAQTFKGTETTISMSGKTTGIAVGNHTVTDNGHTHTVN